MKPATPGRETCRGCGRSLPLSDLLVVTGKDDAFFVCRPALQIQHHDTGACFRENVADYLTHRIAPAG